MTLKITSNTNLGDGQFSAMPRGEAESFSADVNTALAEIRKCPGGDDLINQISGSTSVLSICGTTVKGNSAGIMLRETSGQNAGCYEEVLSAKKLGDLIGGLLQKNIISENHIANLKYKKFYEDLRYQGTGSVESTASIGYRDKDGRRQTREEKTSFSVTYPMAHLPDKPHSDAHSTDKIIPGNLKRLDSKQTINESKDVVRLLQNGLIAYHLMKHMTKGPGTSAYVAWDPKLIEVSEDQEGKSQANWMKRPSWIALAHEMIHGWRLVTGQCVFHPHGYIEKYYEEAMTVGLPPYHECEFTENKFRLACGEPLRTFYGSTTKLMSEKAQEKHGTVEKKTMLGSGKI